MGDSLLVSSKVILYIPNIGVLPSLFWVDIQDQQHSEVVYHLTWTVLVDALHYHLEAEQHDPMTKTKMVTPLPYIHKTRSNWI